MAKDTRLINIYLKIHNKRTLTMDDLGYLAKYDPECFEKTCKNIVYKIPEIKSIMEPDTSEILEYARLRNRSLTSGRASKRSWRISNVWKSKNFRWRISTRTR